MSNMFKRLIKKSSDKVQPLPAEPSDIKVTLGVTLERSIPSHVSVCRNCSGEGYINDLLCPQCHGSGRVIVTSQIITIVTPFIQKKV